MSRRRRLAVGLLLGTLGAGPATLNAQQRERTLAAFPAPSATAIPIVVQLTPGLDESSASPHSLRDSLVALARAQIGRRYRWGGETPERGFDCSGLVRYVMGALKVPLPRTANQQARVGRPVARDRAELRPGDLVTFGSSRRISHIGIYVGDGRFVHASTKAGRVIESKLDRPRSPLIKPWRGGRRLILTGDTLAVEAGTTKG